jgi:hypothetical protein
MAPGAVSGAGKSEGVGEMVEDRGPAHVPFA